MERGYARIGIGQVHYRTAGSGEPLLLLHQTAFSSEEYTEVMPLLAEHFKVIAPDTPGYGMSDAPPHPYEIPDYGASLKEFMEQLAVVPACVVGHHTGASIALEIAATYPETVRQLVMSGCPYYEADEREERLQRYSPMRLDADGEYLLDSWQRLKQNMRHTGPEGWHRFLAAQMLAGVRDEEGHHAVFRYDEKPRLRKLSCPTLLVYGEEDTFIKRAAATRALVPHAETVTVKKAGALIALENPLDFAAAIIDFLK